MKYKIFSPVKILTIERATAIEIPIHIQINIDFFEIAPPVISSTCLFKTGTEGSAKTITKPKSAPITIKIQLYDVRASAAPISFPIGINPILTPTKKSVKPIKLYITPMKILIKCDLGSFKVIN